MIGIANANTVSNGNCFIGKPLLQRSCEPIIRTTTYSAECEQVREWLAAHAQELTGEVRPVFQMQDGIIRKIEMESTRVIYRK